MGDGKSSSGLEFGDAAWNSKDDGSIAIFHGRLFSILCSCARVGNPEELSWAGRAIDWPTSRAYRRAPW